MFGPLLSGTFWLGTQCKNTCPTLEGLLCPMLQLLSQTSLVSQAPWAFERIFPEERAEPSKCLHPPMPPSKCQTGHRPHPKTLHYCCEQKAGGLRPCFQKACGTAVMGDTGSPDSQITRSLSCTICASPGAAEIRVAEYQLQCKLARRAGLGGRSSPFIYLFILHLITCRSDCWGTGSGGIDNTPVNI